MWHNTETNCAAPKSIELCCSLLRCHWDILRCLSRAKPNNLPLMVKSDISEAQWFTVWPGVIPRCHWVEAGRRWSRAVRWSWDPVFYMHSRTTAGKISFTVSRMAYMSKDQGHCEACGVRVGKPPQLTERDNSFLKFYFQEPGAE